MSPLRAQRLAFALGAALTVALGLASRTAWSPLPPALAAVPGDVLYATLMVLLAAAVWPGAAPWRLGAAGLTASAAVELSQLVQAPALVALRATRLGRLVLGSGFLWSDLAWYAAGAALGAAAVWGVQRQARRHRERRRLSRSRAPGSRQRA